MCTTLMLPCKKGGKMAHQSAEGDISGLTVCLELVDERQKLQAFIKTHKDILKDNTGIYKEVEFGEYKE